MLPFLLLCSKFERADSKYSHRSSTKQTPSLGERFNTTEDNQNDSVFIQYATGLCGVPFKGEPLPTTGPNRLLPHLTNLQINDYIQVMRMLSSIKSTRYDSNQQGSTLHGSNPPSTMTESPEDFATTGWDPTPETNAGWLETMEMFFFGTS